jgi:hypothetical protein
MLKNNLSVMNLIDIHSDILTLCLTYLFAVDLYHVSKTCKFMYSLIRCSHPQVFDHIMKQIIWTSYSNKYNKLTRKIWLYNGARGYFKNNPIDRSTRI